jgi:hypothetical protein
MPEYDTELFADKEIEHSCFRELWFGVQRSGWAVICITQKFLQVTDAKSYSLLEKKQRIAVLYRLKHSH